MKERVPFLLFFLSVPFVFLQAQVRWDGGGDRITWSDPLNWVNDQVPGILDDVLLDNSIQSGGYTVTLPDGGITVTVNSIRIVPASGHSILLLLPASNTAIPGFIATSSGDAVVLDSGAVFHNSSGASSGTPVVVGPNSFFRINNGAHYIHNTPRGHATNFVSRLSQEPGTERGVFEFRVPGSAGSGYVVSASGRVFGTLILSGAAAQQNKSYTASGANMLLVRGDLILKEGASFTFNIRNNLGTEGEVLVEPGCDLNLSPADFPTELILGGNLRIWGRIRESGSGKPMVFFKGGLRQWVGIYGDGKLEGDSLQLRLDNPSGLGLLTALQVPFHFIFSNGQVEAPPDAPLIFAPEAFWTGATARSHVNGPVQKMGKSDFVFPVGVGNLFSPLALLNRQEAAENDLYEVTYLRQNPQSDWGNQIADTLDHISQMEYWKIDQISGSGEAVVELFAGEFSFVNDTASLFPVHLQESGFWQPETKDTFLIQTLNPMTGILRSGPVTNVHGLFTFGSTRAKPFNPLPVKITDWHLEPSPQGYELIWRMEEKAERGTLFILERAIGNGEFEELVRIPAGEKTEFRFEDDWKTEEMRFENGHNLRYRIREQSGSREDWVSPVVTGRINMQQKTQTMVFPNPILDRSKIRWYQEKSGTTEWRVTDLFGNIRARVIYQSVKGWNQTEINMEIFPRGFYILCRYDRTRWVESLSIWKR